MQLETFKKITYGTAILIAVLTVPFTYLFLKYERPAIILELDEKTGKNEIDDKKFWFWFFASIAGTWIGLIVSSYTVSQVRESYLRRKAQQKKC